jgi:peptidyl-prolyl cis-trans isomerase A (cyclophilin A)
MARIKTNFYPMLLMAFMLFACQGKTNQEGGNITDQETEEQSAKEQEKTSFEPLSHSVFNIETFAGERRLERGKGFVVGKNLLVAPYVLFHAATHAMVTNHNGENTFKLSHYRAIDRINDLIILQADSIDAEPLKLYNHPKTEGLRTFIAGRRKNNTLPVYSGRCNGEQLVNGNKLLHITNFIEPSNTGIPVFVSTGAVLGMATYREVMHERTYFAVPTAQILTLLSGLNKQPVALSNMSNPDERRNASVKRIALDTDYGVISIRLFNETPVYRDNFIRLVEEGFYDSLLIHRVIRDFGIQTGAADTRYALSDDPVGWKGPGYTLPAHIVKGLYHKRGVIGSPRKPDNKNEERRSDGGQFYIVTGRKYNDEELDKIETENNIRFTAEQREVYKSIGGAPHLDGAYTVFGEVVSGIEIADRITNFATHINYRPQKDIRLKRVLIDF